MKSYKYSGINRFGKRVTGEVQANNSLDFETRINSQKITILNYKENTKSSFAFLNRKIIKKRDIITITSQLRQLLGAGVSLMDILKDLRETYEDNSIREMLASIHEDMRGGSSLSEALSTYENEFGSVYISLISVGEKTGQLEKILKKLEDMIKWEEELASKAKKVMIYPSIVAFVVMGVILMMMVFVVPELVVFVEEMGGELGFTTIALIATSRFVGENIILILISPFMLAIGLKFLLVNSTKFRAKFDYFILKIKIIGPVLYNLKTARLASSLSILYTSGIGFTDSLRMSSKVLDNKYLEQNITESVKLIEEGGKIYESFQTANVFPAMAIRMVKVGEISGNMDESLANISEYYDAEAKEMIEKIEPAIEPLLTIIMAVVVGWVMLAVLGPVYDTISQVQ
jgi:type IV pilus assembly protein PilC